MAPIGGAMIGFGAARGRLPSVFMVHLADSCDFPPAAAAAARHSSPWRY